MRFQALCIQNGVRLANNRLKHVDVRTLHLGETRMPRRGRWLACQSGSAGTQASACSHCTIRACTWYQSSPKQCEHGTCHQSLREQHKCEAAFACDHKWLSTQRHNWHHNKYRLEMVQLKWCMTRSHHRWGRSAHCAARFQRILRALHHPDRRLPGTLRATHSCSVHLARRVSWLYHDGPQSCHGHCRGCCQEHSFHCTGCALLFLNIWGPHGQTDSRGASRNGIRRQCNPHSGARRGYPDCLSASNARPLQQRHPNSVARV